MREKTGFLSILKELRKNHVDFIVVGGVSAVIHGAPITTLDLDVVHSINEENIRNLLNFLKNHDAKYRGQGKRILRPKSRHLNSKDHQLFITDLGPLDVLGAIGELNEGYEDLIKTSEDLLLEDGTELKVLSLEKLIELKEGLGRAKDRAVIEVLKATLEEKNKI